MELRESARPDWLFTYGAESIRSLTDTTGLMLLMCGPGRAEHIHTFDSPKTREVPALVNTWFRTGRRGFSGLGQTCEVAGRRSTD
jgi:hypothetical protein